MNRPGAAATAGHTTSSGVRVPEFNGVAPRITAADIGKHRGGFVTLICKPECFDANLNCVNLVELISGTKLQMYDLQQTSEVAQVNEFVMYVNPASGMLHYQTHATYNDEFDTQSYKQLLELMAKAPGLF